MKPISEMSAGELAAFFQLVPKLHLGTKMSAKLSLAEIKGVPKHSLETRKIIQSILKKSKDGPRPKANWLSFKKSSIV